MTLPIGSLSLAGMVASQSAIDVAQQTLVAAQAELQAAASVLLPPGSEGASDKATAQALANVTKFGADSALGTEYLEEFAANIGMAHAGIVVVEAGNVSSLG